MDGDVHFLHIPTPKDVLSVKSSYLQMIDPIPDFLAAQVLYIQMPIFTGSTQTDKQHAHKLFSSLKLLLP
jgi:hypothetical protein